MSVQGWRAALNSEAREVQRLGQLDQEQVTDDLEDTWHPQALP